MEKGKNSDVKIVVMYDENSDISAVKVNDILFFRKMNEETVVEFFNNIIIPELYDKDIVLKDYYKKENITEIYQSDYKIQKEDKIFLADIQFGYILRAASFDELDLDEKLYVAHLFRNKFSREFNGSSDDFKLIQNFIFDEMTNEISRPRDVEDFVLDCFDEKEADFIMEDQPRVRLGGFFGRVKKRIDLISDSLEKLRIERSKKVNKKVTDRLENQGEFANVKVYSENYDSLDNDPVLNELYALNEKDKVKSMKK